MASTLAPQLLLRKRLGSCWAILPLSQRFIRHSHQNHGKLPAGVPQAVGETTDYRPIQPRKPWSKVICLWSKGQNLGVMTMHKVMKDFLGPGKILSWRGPGEVPGRPHSTTESRRPADGGEIETLASTRATPRDKPKNVILHYDIISIPEPEDKPLDSAVRRTLEEKGKFQVFVRSNAPIASGPGHNMHQLSNAYKILANPLTGPQYPVEFHIASPRNPKAPHGLKWALRNRVDLHPGVIVRAFPHDVLYAAFIQMKSDGTDAFFAVVRKSSDPELHHPPKDKEESDPPGEANRTQEASGKQSQLSPERQMQFERALVRSLQRTEAAIHRKFQRSLRTTVRRRLKKVKGSPTTPLPEEISEMQERKKAVIEQALPKVREHIARSFGIKTSPPSVATD